MTETPIPIGMIGGAPGAFMGDVHRQAIGIVGRFTLAAGCFSSRPDIARSAGTALHLSPDRIYPGWAEMAKAEASRADGIRLAVVVTPNHLHLPVSAAFLDAGIAVFCEKPLASHAQDAMEFAKHHSSHAEKMAMAYTYSGYSMVREARALVSASRLGRIRSVQVEYLQDWLGNPDAAGGWRLDPNTGGPGGCLADIGTHAFHLAEFVSGLRASAVSARVSRVIPSRQVPDEAQMQLRFPNGETGGIWVSQVATGCGNALRLRIFGEKAGLSWTQETPESLTLSFPDGRSEKIMRDATTGQSSSSLLPRGHPEGYLEAFARLYADLADMLTSRPAPLLPKLADGLRGQDFVSTALKSGSADGAWVTFSS